MLVFATTKFSDGAWVILLLIPSLVAVFLTIHHHYQSLAAKLSLSNFRSIGKTRRHRVILLVGGVHRGSLIALNYARALSPDVTAVHVSTDPQEAEKVQSRWSQYGEGTRLVILDSPYRLLVEPVMEYIDRILSEMQPREMLTVVLPQFVPGRWWENLLHRQSALMLRFGLMTRPGVVIVEVPYLT